MSKFVFVLPLFLCGCPVAMAYDVKEPFKCVVDQCDKSFCVVETPEGWVQVDRKPHYEEGLLLTIEECPLDQIDPT